MNPALIQALVVLALIPPATWLLHRGIERDVRRWEEQQRAAALAARVRQIGIRLSVTTAAFRSAMVSAAKAAAEMQRVMEATGRSINGGPR